MPGDTPRYYYFTWGKYFNSLCTKEQSIGFSLLQSCTRCIHTKWLRRCLLPEHVILPEHSPPCSTGRISLTLTSLTCTVFMLMTQRSQYFRILGLSLSVSPLEEMNRQSDKLKQLDRQLVTRCTFYQFFTMNVPQQVSYPVKTLLLKHRKLTSVWMCCGWFETAKSGRVCLALHNSMLSTA